MSEPGADAGRPRPDDPRWPGRACTTEPFIEQIATRSSLTGEDDRIRFPDGLELPAGGFLQERLSEIDRER